MLLVDKKYCAMLVLSKQSSIVGSVTEQDTIELVSNSVVKVQFRLKVMKVQFGQQNILNHNSYS